MFGSLLLLINVATPQALTITQDAGSKPTAGPTKIGDWIYTVALDPRTGEHLDAGASAARIKLLNDEFDGRNADGSANKAVDWTFAAGAEREGKITIAQYDAYLRNPLGGAIIDLSYNGAGAPTDLRWIQFVETNVQLGNEGNPSVDPPNTSHTGGDDNLPFYFTEDETSKGFSWVDKLYDNPGKPKRTVQNPDANTDLVFLDRASRALQDAQKAPVDWDAYLYLVTWDGKHGGKVTIHDGVHWGFTITAKGGANKVPESSPGLIVFGLGILLFAGGHHRLTVRSQNASSCS